jgi:hypothetical protein
MSEAFRLKQALPNSDLQAPVKRSISFTCSQSTRQGTNTPSTQSSTLFHTQLPAPQQPAQHQPAEAYFPPQNLCDFKPWLKSSENSSKPPPSTIASNTMAFGSADNGGPSATPAIWNTLGSQTQQHLEAYILRTTVKSPQNSSITWYYDVDFLPLDNDAMVAHIRNLGSGYSIIEAIGELSPEQLRFVQERTKACDSQLLSVQFGVAADVVTTMGTFKVKPVIFVVKTAAAPARPKSVFNKASFQNPSVPAAGSLFGVSAKATSLGLFGTNTNLLSTSKSSTSSTDSSTSQPLDGPNGLFKASRAQETAPLSTVVDADEASVPKSIFTAPNLFDTCMPAAQSGSFGANTIKPHPGFMALINSHSKSRTSRLDRAPCQDYADGLCTYEEPDAWGNEYTNCRYMTLPSFFSGLGGKNSFEEVRLANYKWELIDGDAIPKCSVKPANSVQNVETIGSAKEPAVPPKSPWQAPCGFKDLAARLDGPRTRPIPQASRRYFSGIGWGSTNLLPSQAVDRSNVCTFPYEGQPKSESAEAQDLAALPESAFGSSKVAVSTNTFEFGAHINPVPAPVKAPSLHPAANTLHPLPMLCAITSLSDCVSPAPARRLRVGCVMMLLNQLLPSVLLPLQQGNENELHHPALACQKRQPHANSWLRRRTSTRAKRRRRCGQLDTIYCKSVRSIR